MNRAELKEQIERRWPANMQCRFSGTSAIGEVACDRSLLVDLCHSLFHEWGFSFASLIVEETESNWQLRYVFYGEGEASWVHVLASAPLIFRHTL